MAKKEFMYRGKSLEQLKALDIKELAELFPANVRRKIKRGFTEQEQRFLQKLRSGKKKVIKTHCRDFIILPEMVGMMIKIHNGKEYIQVNVLPEMIGHTFGEYSLTRKRVSHNSPGVGATRSSSSVSVR